MRGAMPQRHDIDSRLCSLQDIGKMIREALDREAAAPEAAGRVSLITVGTRLEPLLAPDPRITACIPGGTAAE
jgi:hypothetical protein